MPYWMVVGEELAMLVPRLAGVLGYCGRGGGPVNGSPGHGGGGTTARVSQAHPVKNRCSALKVPGPVADDRGSRERPAVSARRRTCL